MKDWLERVWDSEGTAAGGPGALRALLTPLEWAYGLGTAMRNWLYDRRLLRSEVSPIPALAVGNLTVGGTGKTPVAAWLATHLVRLGRRPAIVMRGYGRDEVEVHRLLNPEVPVYVAPRRVAGVKRAADLGADVAVLDDAFQHRALRADTYVLLVAAEQWTERPRLLPRGPWRERWDALERAHLVVVTRKEASSEQAERVAEAIANIAPAVALARAHIGLSTLVQYDAIDGLGQAIEPVGLRCRLAVAGVARPAAVWRQLEEQGVICERRLNLSDHHRYGQKEISEIAAIVGRGRLLATLKDAVKLGGALPPEVQICVPVQTVIWESGAQVVQRVLDTTLVERGELARSPR